MQSDRAELGRGNHQDAACGPKSSNASTSMQSTSQNPVGTVVNQPKQPFSQYGPLSTMIPLQLNFVPFVPVAVNPQFSHMAAACGPKSSTASTSMQSTSQNPIGTVVNQPKQPSSQYGPISTMIPLQPNFAPFLPVIMNPQFSHMYQKKAYDPPQYPTVASRQSLWNYKTPSTQNSSANILSQAIYSQESMHPQMSTPSHLKSISSQPITQHTRKERNAIPIIDPKTGKNVFTVDKNAEDKCYHPNSEKESESVKPMITTGVKELVLPIENEVLGSSAAVGSKIPEKVLSEGKKKKKKDLNKQGKGEDDWEMISFLDTKEGAASSPVSPLPKVTTISTSVPIHVSQGTTFVPRIDNDILNVISFPGEKSATTSQTNKLPSEVISETSSVAPFADKGHKKKIVLKYSYNEDQWSPLNPEGKKQYDREFLLQLQSEPLSLRKLSNLPNLNVIKDKARIQKLTEGNSASPAVVNNSGVRSASEPKKKKVPRAQKVASKNVNSKTRKSMGKMKKHLLSLFEKNTELEEVFNWINDNVLDTSEPPFVRALVTAVHESCFIGSGIKWELNIVKLKSRISLISRYVSNNKKLQLQVLYAVQALVNELGQPNGLLRQICNILSDEGVISDETVVESEQNDDPNED